MSSPRAWQCAAKAGLLGSRYGGRSDDDRRRDAEDSKADLTQLLQLMTRFEVAGEVHRSVYPSDALAELTIGLQ